MITYPDSFASAVILHARLQQFTDARFMAFWLAVIDAYLMVSANTTQEEALNGILDVASEEAARRKLDLPGLEAN